MPAVRLQRWPRCRNGGVEWTYSFKLQVPPGTQVVRAGHTHTRRTAGITGTTNITTEKVDPTDFDRVLRVNLRGIFIMCHEVLPIMRLQGYGRILNVASIAGKDGNAGMLAYSASKAAVIGLTSARIKTNSRTCWNLISRTYPCWQRSSARSTPRAELLATLWRPLWFAPRWCAPWAHHLQ